MKIRTPAKLILTGEHAVVYGNPAFAVAVNHYADITLNTENTNTIRLISPALNIDTEYPLDMLDALHQQLSSHYQQFLNQEITTQQMLSSPGELCLFVIAHFLQTTNIEPSTGLTCSFDINIPIGCGMGSSAAVIVSLLNALDKHFKTKLDYSQFMQIALDAENLQHGYSSGLDLAICYQGGAIQYQSKAISTIELPELPFCLIHTGQPNCSTGECVSQVATRFRESDIWSEFNDASMDIIENIQTNNIAELSNAIKRNHCLLSQIGVVPNHIQECIQTIEDQGSAAKICGAGAIKGDNAGMMIAINNDAIKKICQQYHFTLLPLEIDHHGSRQI